MGVNAFDDSALIVRVRLKTKPDMGSLIQRRVFERLKELFDEQGLEFATRHVMERLPEDITSEKHGAENEPLSAAQASQRKEALSAAAGAAIVLALAEEEARQKQLHNDAES
jgi:moderate conductance mechanosensitive channel